MQNLNGRMYVKGTVDISAEALARLAEVGVVPSRNPYTQGGEFESFYLPVGNDGAEFHHAGGNPAQAGKLTLK